MDPKVVAKLHPKANPRRNRVRSPTLKPPRPTPDLNVSIAHEDYSCRVESLGLANSLWLLQCLSRSFAFKTSAPLRADGPNELCTFRLAYGSYFTKGSLESLLLSIPGMTLRIRPGDGKPRTPA